MDDTAIGSLGETSKIFTQAVMYRVFAEVLAVRLRDANQKNCRYAGGTGCGKRIIRTEAYMKEIPFDPNDKETLTRLQQMPVFGAMAEDRLPKVLGMQLCAAMKEMKPLSGKGHRSGGIFLIMGSCTVPSKE